MHSLPGVLKRLRATNKRLNLCKLITSRQVIFKILLITMISLLALHVCPLEPPFSPAVIQELGQDVEGIQGIGEAQKGG